jgi:hypothetical protein
MDEQGQKSGHRKVYGKGFIDGMRAAAKEAGMGLSASRARELEQALSGVERKVYEHLSVQSPMSSGEVVGQIRRATGSVTDIRIVDGCLENLVERGLAKKSGGKYQREAIKDRPAVAKLEVVKTMAVTEKAPDSKAESNVDEIRRLSGEIVERLDKIEDCAKAIEREKDKANERNAKAAKLAELLKDFNG